MDDLILRFASVVQSKDDSYHGYRLFTNNIACHKVQIDEVGVIFWPDIIIIKSPEIFLQWYNDLKKIEYVYSL